MAKSRRNKSRKKKGFVVPLPLTVFLVFGASIALVYICMESRGHLLGEKIKQLEQQQAVLNTRYNYELSRWESMKAPAEIETALQRHNINMVWPRENQIVRLNHPDIPAGRPGAYGEIASVVKIREGVY